jgi:hypothetical protein
MKSSYEFQNTGIYVRVLLYIYISFPFFTKFDVYVLEIPEKIVIKYFI